MRTQGIVLWCLGLTAAALICIGSVGTSSNLLQLPSAGTLTSTDLVYVVSGGLDRKATISQVVSMASNGPASSFHGYTTNLTNYGSMSLPTIPSAANSFLLGMSISNPSVMVKVAGLDFQPYHGLNSLYGFSGDGTRLYNLNGATIIPGTLSALPWQNEVANTILMGPASAPDAIPTFRSLSAADVPNKTIHLVHLADEVISLLSTNGSTNYFTPNFTNAALYTATNHGAFTITDDSGHTVRLSAGDGLLAPQAQIIADSFIASNNFYGLNLGSYASPFKNAWITNLDMEAGALYLNGGTQIHFEGSILACPDDATLVFYSDGIDGGAGFGPTPGIGIYATTVGVYGDGSMLSNIISTAVLGVTNATPPVNTTSIKAWANITLTNGVVFKMPLYQ